ncbi:MAG: ribosome hibernation-promoting factor, HPF/YfiA family [Clostridia bacterium]
MNIKITGKDLKATESIKDYISEKLERIQKYFDEDFDVSVTIKAEKNVQVAEMAVMVKGDSFRAVTEHKDLYASIDKDIDILEGQIRKAKTKKDKQNKTESIKQKELLNAQDHEIENEIVKTIYYNIKPMTPEDAKLKMLEKPIYQFLTFVNIETGKVNVIYKLRESKNFGLIEPEE